jgi:hypothetical protein
MTDTNDDDLKLGRILGWIGAFANLIAAALNARSHNWTIALACAVWVFNSVMLLQRAETEQKTRDAIRLITAMIHGMDPTRKE